MAAFFGVPGVVVVHMFDRTKKWLWSPQAMSDKKFEDFLALSNLIIASLCAYV